MIYIITHKIFDNICSKKSNYTVLHVGVNNDTCSDYLNDNFGDNICVKNKNYCELTGIYWLWKNSSDLDSDPIGIVHYRRYFVTKFSYMFYYFFNLKPKVIKFDEFTEILCKYDVVLPKPIKIFKTVRHDYISSHNEEDLLLVRESISETNPGYLSDFDSFMNSHKYYYANMMVLRKSLFNSYCEWLFSILTNLESKINLDKYENDYQKRVYGFLSERLLCVWVKHNNLKVYELPVYNTESRPVSFLKINFNRFKNLCLKFTKNSN